MRAPRNWSLWAYSAGIEAVSRTHPRMRQWVAAHAVSRHAAVVLSYPAGTVPAGRPHRQHRAHRAGQPRRRPRSRSPRTRRDRPHRPSRATGRRRPTRYRRRRSPVADHRTCHRRRGPPRAGDIAGTENALMQAVSTGSRTRSNARSVPPAAPCPSWPPPVPPRWTGCIERSPQHESKVLTATRCPPGLGRSGTPCGRPGRKPRCPARRRRAGVSGGSGVWR